MCSCGGHADSTTLDIDLQHLPGQGVCPHTGLYGRVCRSEDMLHQEWKLESGTAELSGWVWVSAVGCMVDGHTHDRHFVLRDTT